MIRTLLLAALALATLGCEAQAPRPPSPAPAASAAERLAPLEEALAANQGRFDALDERFLLLQEQLLEANRKLETLTQRTQQQLVALQRVQMLQAQAARAPAEGEGESGPTALDQLTELVDRLERLNSETAAAATATGPAADGRGFNMVSAVTHLGQWVILKYDEITGLTWNALDGGWVEVGEPEPLDNSHYQVVLRPSRTDVKNYVAARIDRQTGQTWWLKNNRWEPFP